MSASEYFSATYGEARGKFLAACAEQGLAVSSYRNPERGAAGEDLLTDAVRIGPEKAARVLVASSGTHGVEGYCGSGCQIGQLRAGIFNDLPADTAVLLVHAINPHGFSWNRRVTEDNVDFNRNHLDHAGPYPANPAYDEVHAMLVPEDWDGPARAAADAAIDDYIAERGLTAFQAAVSGGQYNHEEGLFFGGFGPTWSHGTLHDIVRNQLRGCRVVALVDYHTGLGPYGHGEIICTQSSTGPGFQQTKEWYGDEVTSPEEGSSTSAVVQGTVVDSYERLLPDARVSGIGLEFGTQPVEMVLAALRADNWLHLHGDPGSDFGRQVKADMRAAFYPEATNWKGMVLSRAVAVTQMALAGLARS